MLRRSAVMAMRMPMGRRPKERSWEVFNGKTLAGREGGQNMRMALGTAIVMASIGSYEMYQQWCRLVARGDTCAACEQTRRRFRARMAHTQEQMGT
eukprot:CAMPEP_0174850646 /NCGR_PEP_ID=MMETSP1114-20130205/20551_1 /TAXON_ID=312471 /ORGANISM="Neobodo designis, Strain CCAP 1951/1" /LENGTH=95 /DNA_ID=CAMNT_0016085119 /DNA_START=35 /DNA_END=322 /DNA_ORIENTATION=+